MDRLMIAAVVAAPILATAGAVGGYQYKMHNEDSAVPEGYARVISSEPIMKDVKVAVPRESCWQEKVVKTETKKTESEGWKAGSTALGAVIGGSLGHKVGSGRGKDVATVAGAAVGGKIGHDVYKSQHKPEVIEHVTYEQRCKTVNDYHTETQTQGYAVTYEYKGQVFNTEMAKPPEGELMPVEVTINPQPTS